MKFNRLLKDLDYQAFGNIPKEVSGVSDDSRRVVKDGVFVAISGLTVDGHQFIPQAIKNGAKVVVGEADPKKLKLEGAVYVRVDNSRKALGLLAAAWYDNPAKKMKIIGVTGTDGKTTTANMLYHILKKSGKRVGLISTVSAKIGEKQYNTGPHVTNPEPLALHKFLNQMAKKGCEYAVLEVTSHGLDQERVAGIDFEIAVLTNITHEHLDYHKTFSAYKKAKLKLFQNAKVAILNKNDKNSNWIKKNINSKVLFYGKNQLAKQEFLEPYNQQNASAAIAVARYLKIPKTKIAHALESFPGVEGRMQEVKNKRDIKIIIDFAHTPNGLKNVLNVLSKNKKGRLIAVIACEGERDRQKRPMMAEISGRLADITILNAIDLRSEKAKNIISDMEKGIKKTKGQYFKIEDRAKAIAFALNQAQKGDTVVLCGKGHEKSMNLGGKKERPWSDEKVVKSFLKKTGEITKFKRIHFTGIKGVGMASLAICCQDLGIKVQGSDIDEVFVTDETLKKANIKWFHGFKASNLKMKPDLLVTTGAHGGLNNPEVLAAKKRGISVMTHAEALGFLAAKKELIAVCGVGGKTTTSSMIATILEKAGEKPSFAIGVGNIFPINTPGKFSTGRHFVCEADEYAVSPGIDMRPRFSFLNPKILVVTNIEHDHPDVYPTFADTKKTFIQFFKRIPKDGWLIANLDNKNIASLITTLREEEVPIQTYGLSKKADWQIGDIKISRGETTFSLTRKKQKIQGIKITVPGEYNIHNAAAAIISTLFAGVSLSKIKDGISAYQGCRRRFEKMGLSKGVLFYDDYAHHPAEIKAALKAARDWFPKEKLIVVFQPHTYSRTKMLFDDFAKSFRKADTVALMDIYASARESQDLTVSSKKLAAEMKKWQKNVFYTKGHQETISWLKKNAQKGNVVLTLGAGDIFHLYNKLF